MYVSEARPMLLVLNTKERLMHDHHVYKVVELVGSSPASIEDAIKSAIACANSTLRNL